MSELEKYIETYFGVPTQDVHKISTFFSPKTIRKGEYFLTTGQYSQQLGFVQSGILREFVYIDDREVTKWISTQGYFVVDIASFYFSTPSRWNIQALSDSELYIIDRDSYAKISSVVPSWNTLEKLFIAKCFAVLEDRVVQHIALSAEERYARLFAFNKELFNLVPLQYIASMLGMTPETLSRLRKKSLK